MMHEDISPDTSSMDASESFSNEEAPTPSWMLDESTPGVGDRPEWLPEKFKSVSDLSKSYRELEKKLVSNVPKEYDLSNSKYLDPEFEGYANLAKIARDNRVPQEVMNEFVNTIDGYLDTQQANPEAEMAKLGADASQRIEVLENWVETNLDKDNAAAIFSEIKTAEGIKALEILRNKMMENQSSIPNGNDSSSDSLGSVEDIQKELASNLDKYKTDPKYQREIQAKLSRFAQNSDYIDKNGS